MITRPIPGSTISVDDFGDPVVDALNQTKLWTVTSTSGTSTVSSETVVGTAPTATYKAHSAYLIKFRGLMRASGASVATINIRDTNASGTQRMSPAVFNIDAGSQNRLWYWEHVVANTSASDIANRVLVLTLAGTSAFINAASTLPWFWTCGFIGADSDYPEAVAL